MTGRRQPSERRSGARLLVGAVVALGLLCSACSSSGSDDTTVLVFAAASLSEAFAELAVEFEQANPGIDVQLNIGGSSGLREQILNGAPADVFASANEQVMTDLVEAGEMSTPEIFATNHLVIAVPIGNPGGVQGFSDLERSDLLVGLCASGVPCGDLAREVLDQVGVAAALDTNEPDVRSLRTKLAEGELDVGLVYLTDVLADDDLDVVDAAVFDDISTRYPIAASAQSDDDSAAHRFTEFVLSPDARSILADHGFGAP